MRIWRRTVGTGEPSVLGLYRADSETELTDLLGRLPLYEWMNIGVTPFQPHPNDPRFAEEVGPRHPADRSPLPAPRLTHVYRLEATPGEPLDLGLTNQGRRRVVALTGGTVSGLDISGVLLLRASADWQIVLADRTALLDLRCTLRTDEGDLIFVQSRGVRHGRPEVLERLGRGDQVDPSEYTFRTTTRMETAAPELDWLNKGVFISVGGRRPSSLTYDTYLVALPGPNRQASHDA
jgi:Protein of unknown function (DUF3237)/Muconolactone delta-isomerase